jgi:hypothetical protein
MRNSIKLPLILALAVSAGLLGCLFDSKEARRGSVVENEVLAGVLYTESGDPAVGASVKVFPVDHVPNKGLIKAAADTSVVYTYTTDKDGRYLAAGLPPGQYNFLGEMDGAYSYMDSVVVKAEPGPLPSDTLTEPGSITGIVLLEPNHDPRTVFVQVLGTNRFANADSAGRFTLKDMAGGTYAIRVLTTLPEYAPVFSGFRVRSGRSDTLGSSIQLIYTGTPVVRGLKAAYDTATAIVSLSWKATQYPFLKEYVVYRKDSESLTAVPTLIGKGKDTVFADTVLEQATDTGKGPRRYEYGIRLRNRSEVEGLPFETVTVGIPPVSSVATAMTLSMEGNADSRSSIGDTVRLTVAWENPTRDNDSLIWFRVSDGERLRASKVEGRKGSDALTLTLPGQAGPYGIGVRVLDETGSVWTGKRTLQVVQDAPAVSAGKDTSVTPRDTLRLQGKATQEFGTIVEWEWDIGAKGVFVRTSTGDTTITAPASQGELLCIVRATDDDGNKVTDMISISVVNDAPSIAIQTKTRAIENGGGYGIHADVTDHGRIVKWEWDIGNTGSYAQGSGPDTFFVPVASTGYNLASAIRVTDEDGNRTNLDFNFKISKWSYTKKLPLPDGKNAFDELAAAAMDGKIFFAGGLSGDKRFDTFFSYDPTTGKIDTLPPMLDVRARNALIPLNGKLYVIGGNGAGGPISTVEVYDPALKEWSRVANLPKPMEQVQAIALNGKIWVADYKEFMVFDPALDRWSKLPNHGTPQGSGSIYTTGFATLNGLIFTNLNIYYGGDGRVQQYDPIADVWSDKNTRSPWASYPSITVLDGKIYTIGEESLGNFIGVQAFDPVADSRDQSSDLIYRVFRNAAVTIAGKIYVLGQESTIQIYDPALDPGK